MQHAKKSRFLIQNNLKSSTIFPKSWRVSREQLFTNVELEKKISIAITQRDKVLKIKGHWKQVPRYNNPFKNIWYEVNSSTTHRSLSTFNK